MSSVDIVEAPPAGETTRAGGAWQPRLLAFALAAGLLSGLAAWWGGEMVYGRLLPALSAPAGIPTQAEAAAATSARRAGVLSETTAARGLLGLLLGASLGAAGGLGRRSPREAAKAAAVGAALGATAAVIAVRVAIPFTFRLRPPDGDDLVPAILIQGAIAAATGAAAGLAFALGAGLRPAWQAVAGGLLGGFAGLVAYQVLGAVAFPLASTSEPVATTSAARLSAQILVAALSSAGAALAAGRGRDA